MEGIFRTLIVETVGFCNLSCSICPTNCYGGAFKKVMPEKIFDRLIPYFYPGLTVILTGWGEPLLDKDLETRIASAKKAGATVYISTHATLLTEERCRSLLDSGIDGISISLDAAKEETYRKIRKASFARVIKNIRRLLKLRRERGERTIVDLSFVANRENLADLPLFLELAEDLEVDSVAITPKFLLFSKEDLERFYVSARIIQQELAAFLKKKDYPFSIRTTGLEPFPEDDCFAGAVSAVFVSATGRVSPCCNLGHPIPRYTPRWKKPKYFFLSFGDICQQPLDKVWNSPLYQDFRQKLSKGKVPLECRGCHLLPAKKGFLG